MKQTIFISCAIVSVAIAINSVLTAAPPSTGKYDLLKVGKMVIGGIPGQPSIVMSSNGGLSQLMFLDKRDALRGIMSHSDGETSFSIIRGDGKSALEVSVDDKTDTLMIEFESPDGKPAIQIVSQKTGHIIMTKDESGTPRIAHGFVNGKIVNKAE